MFRSRSITLIFFSLTLAEPEGPLVLVFVSHAPPGKRTNCAPVYIMSNGKKRDRNGQVKGGAMAEAGEGGDTGKTTSVWGEGREGEGRGTLCIV